MQKGKKLTQNVNKDKFFNDLPKVSPLSSSWLTRHTNYQSSNLGRIVPIYYDEILPGEEREIRMAMTSHTTTPVAPIFNSLYTELRSFFVPMRLAADLLNGYKTRKSPFVKVFGEDNVSSDSKIIVPLNEQVLPSFTVDHQFIVDIDDVDGSLPKDNVFDSLDLFMSAGDSINQNFLNLAAYELIYQRHYRNENYEAATASPLYRLLFDAYNAEKASVSLAATFDYEIANREKDYFTGMKPFTQKGDPVMVSIGTSAEVKLKDKFKINSTLESGDIHDLGVQKLGFEGAYGDAGSKIFPVPGDENLHGSDAGILTAGEGLYTYFDPNGTMYADLTSAQGLSVEQLRLLIKTQELLEKDAMYGSLYAQSLNSHFGCCPLDETLQDPAELYKVTITSNMQAIFQTSSTSGEASILGTIGANSTTQTDPFVILPKTRFKEHGILMICAVHKLQNVYDSNYYKPKFNFKLKRFDFYTPELNDLGFQPVDGGKEMVMGSGSVGFNEAFAEYRYKYNKSHGSLNISFPYWAPAIGSEYSSAATLYKESTAILDKALSVRSSTAPQFYDAWGFEETNTKPMSLHSIPGFDGVI